MMLKVNLRDIAQIVEKKYYVWNFIKKFGRENKKYWWDLSKSFKHVVDRTEPMRLGGFEKDSSKKKRSTWRIVEKEMGSSNPSPANRTETGALRSKNLVSAIFKSIFVNWSFNHPMFIDWKKNNKIKSNHFKNMVNGFFGTRTAENVLKKQKGEHKSQIKAKTRKITKMKSSHHFSLHDSLVLPCRTLFCYTHPKQN